MSGNRKLKSIEREQAGLGFTPALFYTYIEQAMNEFRDKNFKGVCVNEEIISMCRCADGITITKSKES